MTPPRPPHLDLSVVVPVCNEEPNLPELGRRLLAVLDGLGRAYEIVLTNDGSTDRSFELLRALHAARPDVIRVIDFNANYGQHVAILAAFERVRGAVVVTLDADLQNPPEEIPRLLERIEAGHDYVGGVRRDRRDPWFRTIASRLVNVLRERTTRIRMTDHGCMLRAYRRPLVDAIVADGARDTFIPALAALLARNPAEVEVRHAERRAGRSNYSFTRLVRLNFDLVTGCTLAPLQAFTFMAFGCAAGSFLLLLFLLGRRLVLGPGEGWLFTLLGLGLVLVSLGLVGIGLVGEYLGRLSQAVRARPRYQVREILDSTRE